MIFMQIFDSIENNPRVMIPREMESLMDHQSGVTTLKNLVTCSSVDAALGFDMVNQGNIRCLSSEFAVLNCYNSYGFFHMKQGVAI